MARTRTGRWRNDTTIHDTATGEPGEARVRAAGALYRRSVKARGGLRGGGWVRVGSLAVTGSGWAVGWSLEHCSHGI